MLVPNMAFEAIPPMSMSSASSVAMESLYLLLSAFTNKLVEDRTPQLRFVVRFGVSVRQWFIIYRQFFRSDPLNGSVCRRYRSRTRDSITLTPFYECIGTNCTDDRSALKELNGLEFSSERQTRTTYTAMSSDVNFRRFIDRIEDIVSSRNR